MFWLCLRKKLAGSSSPFMIIRTVFTICSIILLSTFILFKSDEVLKEKKVESPVLGVSKDRISENIWSPKIIDSESLNFSDAPEITAKSAFFINTNTGEILYEKNPQEQLSIASLTKIMTTIIALENKSFDDKYFISKRASEMEPDKMLLIEGESLTLKQLLSGIFLVSANDAAEAIAEGTTGRREDLPAGRQEFITLMNSKAAQLGMNKTIFVNPTGLEEDPEFCEGRIPCQYSTALDAAIMSRYLINRWPEIVNISSQPHIYIEQSTDHQDYDLYSGINLLTTYPGVVGLKTGFTPAAGLTLATLARRGNTEILGVLLGATDRRDDAKLMLDYVYAKLGN